MNETKNETGIETKYKVKNMIEWKKDKGYLGMFVIFSIYLKDDKYDLVPALPGIRAIQNGFKTEQDAKNYAQRMLEFWLYHSGLEAKK